MEDVRARIQATTMSGKGKSKIQLAHLEDVEHDAGLLVRVAGLYGAVGDQILLIGREVHEAHLQTCLAFKAA